ncbi:T9SS type A sorting domain-containing protein [bacterium]|nr:T9SS type A sorting domain-containing protein [bacterium]MBU1983038.1 T9SS type A sorting domain-containing protein [bacterium]
MKTLTVLAMIGWGTILFGQPVGSTYVAGDTRYDYQHNGSCGRMIGLDDSGYVHVVWMRGYNIGERRIFYNRWSPAADSFDFPGGTLADQSQLAGYVTLAVTGDGCPIPAFHQINYAADYNAHTAVSLCLESTSMPPWRYYAGASIEIIWPIIALSGDSVIHIISRENNAMGILYDPLYYSRGVLQRDSVGGMAVCWQDYDGSGFEVLDTVATFSFTVAAARYSGRAVRGWGKVIGWSPHSPYDPLLYNNDIILEFSNDAGISWGNRYNITQFTPPDTAWHNQGGHWQVCNRDTLRSFTDLSLLFDPDDVLHAAFTVVPFYHWRNDTVGPYTTRGASLIYHWNEATGQFSLIADGWIPAGCGRWQTIVQRPSLAMDEETGDLYCAYVRYDTAQVSEQGWFNADVWISVSTNGGSSWSVGTNVTRTAPLNIPAPPGDSRSEREPTLAETVQDGFLHLSYVLDLDAGSLPQDEGTATQNDFLYQRIPVDSIPTAPILPNYPLRWDSTGFASSPPRADRIVPERYILYAPYPNPFNSTVQLQFELPREANVNLRVFDVLGRMVETLADGVRLGGRHAITWDAQARASGVYFVVLSHPGGTTAHKMVLLK